MQTSEESFWSEIKSYEDRLRESPASYCFSSLAEVYLKAGLLDDALAVARTGTLRYPAYAEGQMALARACYQAGLFDECRQALLVVTEAVPSHADARRLLARLYAEAGMPHEAAVALQVLLDFYPNDAAVRSELGVLQLETPAEVLDDGLELIEFTEADIVDEPEVDDQLVERRRPAVAQVANPWAGVAADMPQTELAITDELSAVWSVPEQQLVTEHAVAGQDPLVTPTLAELYVSQGFVDKAATIYQKIVVADPKNAAAADRLAELTAQLEPASDGQQPVTETSTNVPEAAAGGCQAVVTVLEGWLGNIQRLRTCH